MFFRKLFHKNKQPAPPPAVPPPAAPEPTLHPLEEAVTGLLHQDKKQAVSKAEQQAAHGDAQRKNLDDFRRLRDAVILPAFADTIALFEKHGGRAHLGKSTDEEWAGESARLNLYGKSEFKGPHIVFSFPDVRRREARMTKTVVDPVMKIVPLDELDAEKVKAEIAAFIEDVRKHRARP